jgi:dTDP-4-amino-4,6-dideoxygalactose transaminase
MEGIQGSILNTKLKHLPEWTKKGRKNADLYRKYLADIKDVAVPVEMSEVKHVYHLFVVRVSKRNELIKYLQDNEIYTGIHYPIPCHLQKAYNTLNKQNGKFPISEKLAKEILSLPMYAELTEKEIQFVCEKIREFYK